MYRPKQANSSNLSSYQLVAFVGVHLDIRVIDCGALNFVAESSNPESSHIRLTVPHEVDVVLGRVESISRSPRNSGAVSIIARTRVSAPGNTKPRSVVLSGHVLPPTSMTWRRPVKP